MTAKRARSSLWIPSGRNSLHRTERSVQTAAARAGASGNPVPFRFAASLGSLAAAQPGTDTGARLAEAGG